MADPVFNVMDARAVTSEPSTRYAHKDKEFNSALMEAIEATSMGSFKLERLPLTSELAEGLADVFDQEAAGFLRHGRIQKGLYRENVFESMTLTGE